MAASSSRRARLAASRRPPGSGNRIARPNWVSAETNSALTQLGRAIRLPEPGGRVQQPARSAGGVAQATRFGQPDRAALGAELPEAVRAELVSALTQLGRAIRLPEPGGLGDAATDTWMA
ncbi:hypothetical protein JHV675_46420 [Mycobacterium avium subsp. hominissuis]